MSQPQATDKRDDAGIRRLASALVDGTLSRDEQTTLERRLLADRAARDLFRRFMEAESILAWEMAASGPQGHATKTREPVGSGIVRRAAAAAAGILRRPGLSVATAAGLAAAILLAAWIGRQPEPVRQAVRVVMPDSGQVATLTADAFARWEGEPFSANGAAAGPGPLRLVAGEAQLTFASGAIVALHAPAEVEVLSASRVFLRNGRITPFVPPAAHGFTVVSPAGEVIDLGTEFTVGVDGSGRTDVFVIDGEIDVASGHSRTPGGPVRMTQGYGSRLLTDEAAPLTTQRPLVIDDFDGPEERLRRLDIRAGYPSIVRDGSLRIPVAAPPDQNHAVTRIVLDHDFSSLAGRRATVSFKVTLPDAGMTTKSRYLGLVIDAGDGEPPMAWETGAALSVLLSPEWQVGVRIDGEPNCQSYVFSRGEDAAGPYQVVVSIDDTPQTRAQRGSATLGVMVNGRELVRDRPFRFPARPRLQLQTFAKPHSDCDGFAVVDDLSVSVSAEPTAAAP